MMLTQDFTTQTKELIDALKSVCTSYGLGNDGNEFKIITQVFLYKFISDKFAHEVKQREPALREAASWEKAIAAYSDDDYEDLLDRMSADSPRLKREHYLTAVANRLHEPNFAKTFDAALREIAILNNDIFGVKTNTGASVILFDELSNYITDSSQRDSFCRAIISPLVNFSFEHVFHQKFDFFATIFEYLIKDYNKDGGGKYAEYFTPHAVAKIMAAILVDAPVSNVRCYDPSAGSGTLLMNLAHRIGEDRCAIYSQDISQKSSGMLRLNLILNNLVHSIRNIIQGNTLLTPYHKHGDRLMTFDYIVSNPPFKLDFSDYRDALDAPQHRERFFAGVPKEPNKDRDKMAIYLLFIQHIIASLAPNGKAAIVVPTGFLTAQSGIERKIRERLVTDKMLRGVVSMPSNIFATTGTNVSVLFLDKANTKGNIVLMDASKLGATVKDGKNQRTVLSVEEEDRIIATFNAHEAVDDFTAVVTYQQIAEKNYSLSAGQYFDVKIEHIDLTPEEFAARMDGFAQNLDRLFAESRALESEINKQLSRVAYEQAQ